MKKYRIKIYNQAKTVVWAQYDVVASNELLAVEEGLSRWGGAKDGTITIQELGPELPTKLPNMRA